MSDDWTKTMKQVTAQGRRFGKMIGVAKPGERDVRLLMEAERLLALVTALSKLSLTEQTPNDPSP